MSILHNSLKECQNIRLIMRSWLTDAADINQYFQDRPPFFILSLGRSGSTFLARMLNKANGVLVNHEPTRIDFIAYLLAYYQPDYAAAYLAGYRKRLMFEYITRSSDLTYGEVNSLLRRHARAIQNVYPSAITIHLVRDGRDVIRSMMARKTFTARDPISSMIKPKANDKYVDQWPLMSRFERMCWYWWSENKYLSVNVGHFVRFEDLIHDYAYFSEYILDVLGLSIPEITWSGMITRPKNKTMNHTFPHWTDWDSRSKDAFYAICGDLMIQFGYEV